MANFVLRSAEPKDVSDILRLIKELAKFEEMEEKVMLTEKGFSVIGFAMYYFTYDPWIGKLLYLEDFYVMQEFRGFGIGSQILKVLSEVQTHYTRCSSMHFIVAENNKQSIEFYKRRGAADLSSEEGWRLFEIQKKDLVKMTAK
uniref:Diamine acetyltransferase 1 n=1 Tax=Xiphophorus couchianus TaxID=32473 RepID=A0A3B5LK04_9TELE